MTELDRAGNLLGALSLSVADRTAEAVGDAAGQSETAAIALSALHQFLGEPSLDRIRRVLGLTPSGAVRLVDRLEHAGHVTRRPSSEDARSVTVRLTPKGRRAAERVVRARGEVLNGTLETLDAEEREQFEGLLARVIPKMMRGPGATRWLCRLCDMDACGRDAGRCPAASAARARWGS
jgi:DNA-binding MarR family transcriptional regulator